MPAEGPYVGPWGRRTERRLQSLGLFISIEREREMRPVDSLNRFKVQTVCVGRTQPVDKSTFFPGTRDAPSHDSGTLYRWVEES